MKKAMRFASVAVMVLLVAAIMVPAVAAQDKPADSADFLYCLPLETTCYLDGSDTDPSGGVYITWHFDEVLEGYNAAPLPLSPFLSDDPDDLIVFTLGIDYGTNAQAIEPLIYFDQSNWTSADGTTLPNGNVEIATALNGALALYYLPGTGEFQVNYIPPGANYVRVLNTFQRSGVTFYAWDSFFLPAVPAAPAEES